ncbi:MAG: SAM-dependent chlorinase/fluorinase [Dehalococcoidia bacterium]
MAANIVTLTTDFGTSDAFVGTMKGIILGINPDAKVVDLTHDVPRQDVRAGAYIFDSAYHYFPQGTVHVIIVDPTVGTNRRPLLVRTANATFICPDNGLLSYAFAREGGAAPDGEPFAPTVATPPDGWTAYQLTNADYWLHPISSTFHGRDIFAPVAGHASRGEPPGNMGVRLDEICVFPVPGPEERDGRLVGAVQHVDWYGNLITNIEATALPKPEENIVVEVGGHQIKGLSRTYADAPGNRDPIVLVGSHGCLEIALPYGNASEALGVGVGDRVAVPLASQHQG